MLDSSGNKPMADKPRVDPYDFVPLGDTRPQWESPPGHDRYPEGCNSGLLECRMTARSPLFTYDPRFVRRVTLGHETVNFPVYNGEVVIQSTSLKGVIRSLCEAIEPCCVSMPVPFPRRYRGKGITRDKEIEVRLPQDFKHCEDRHKLCPACRLFGSLDPQGGRWAYTGKVSISDARSARGQYTLMPHVTLEVLSTPKPEGRPHAYTGADGKTIRGRKFYRHREPPEVLQRMPDERTRRPKQDHQNKTVQPVQEGSQFHFEVEYNDLNASELRLLLYGLVLEDGLYHKLGLGKPIGLGSAQIDILKWTRIDRAQRYRRLGAGIQAPVEGEALQVELTEWLMPYRERDTEALQKLRDILRPDPAVDVRYVLHFPAGR